MSACPRRSGKGARHASCIDSRPWPAVRPLESLKPHDCGPEYDTAKCRFVVKTQRSKCIFFLQPVAESRPHGSPSLQIYIACVRRTRRLCNKMDATERFETGVAIGVFRTSGDGMRLWSAKRQIKRLESATRAISSRNRESPTGPEMEPTAWLNGVRHGR